MYRIQSKDLPKASALLGRAFRDYPLFEHVLPESTSRGEQLQYLCRFLLRLGMQKGLVIAPNNELDGVSIWFHSDRIPKSPLAALRAGLLNLFIHVDAKAIGRFIEIGGIKGKKRADVIGGSYWLCDMIGVDPLCQGNGVGRRMIEAQLNDFDKAAIPCYLETSEANNIAYYEKYGFVLVNEYKIYDVHVFCLQRKPSGSMGRPSKTGRVPSQGQ